MEFFKLHSCGNSCLVTIDAAHSFFPKPDAVARLLDPHRGIGADNLMIIRPGAEPLRISGFNSDGTPVGMCANGLRCCGLIMQKMNLVSDLASDYPIDLDGRAVSLSFYSGGEVGVCVGEASFDPCTVPIVADQEVIQAPLEVEGTDFHFTALSVGNPHCVIHVGDLSSVNLRELGPRIEALSLYPEKTNVEFVQVLSPNEIEVLFWERAVGVTEASGSGSCAAAVASFRLGHTDSRVRVVCPGGELMVSIEPSSWKTEVRGLPELVFSTNLEV